MGCDGIYDRLENTDIFHLIWGFKRKDERFQDFHTFCGNCADAVIKYSMRKLTADNVTVIFIAFKNFENKMKDTNFLYSCYENVCETLEDDVDLCGE